MTRTIVKFDDENLSNFDLFLDFFQVTGTNVIDSYQWSWALRLKVVKMHTAYEDVLRQIPIWQADNEQMQKSGVGSSKEGDILALRYETFLHSVYSLCETLSRITVHFYPTLSHGFREQKNELLGKKNSVDPRYAKILESVVWFDEVHAIRSEATHFLSGIITISKNGEPGYFNTPKNKRDGSLQEISKENIEKHISEIYQNVATFLTQYGDHFIQKIDLDKKIAKPCLLNGEKFMGAREFTLNDVKNKKPGFCHLPHYQCPIRYNCEAFKATPIIEKTKNNEQ